MLTRLDLPAELDGRVWRYAHAAAANRRHRHVELELNLVARGKGTYLLGNRRYEIRRGDLLWLFPAEEHVLFEQSADFAMWVAVFRRRAVTRAAADSTARTLRQRSFPGVACRRLGSRDLDRLEALFTELHDATIQPARLNAGLNYALLQAWHCFQHAEEVTTQELHPGVERVAHLIRNETTELSLPELAHRAALSASRLSRLFKEQTGTTMVEFRNRARLEKFQQLYADGRERTLLNAALDAGFGSYPQFHRVFREAMGYSPAEYARRQKR